MKLHISCENESLEHKLGEIVSSIPMISNERDNLKIISMHGAIDICLVLANFNQNIGVSVIYDGVCNLKIEKSEPQKEAYLLETILNIKQEAFNIGLLYFYFGEEINTSVKLKERLISEMNNHKLNMLSKGQIAALSPDELLKLVSTQHECLRKSLFVVFREKYLSLSDSNRI